MSDEPLGGLQGTTDEVVKPSENQTGFPQMEEVDIEALGKQAEKALNSEVEPPTPPPAPEPVAPVTEPATQPVAEKAETQEAVPEKFKDEDGKLDESKLAKSTDHAKKALEEYEALVKKLNRKRHEAHLAQLKANTGTAEPEAVPTEQANYETVAKQIEDELRTNGTGAGLAKILNAWGENVYRRAQSEIMDIRESAASRERRETLEGIASSDPWVFQPEGQAAIARTLEENPWMESSPNPIQSAYLYYRGQNPLATSSVQPLTPKSPAAPSTPAGGARPPQANKGVNPDNPSEINHALDQMSPEDEDKFWRSQGLPPLVRK